MLWLHCCQTERFRLTSVLNRCAVHDCDRWRSLRWRGALTASHCLYLCQREAHHTKQLSIDSSALRWPQANRTCTGTLRPLIYHAVEP